MRMPPAGVEPTTFALQVRCSAKLSYGGLVLGVGLAPTSQGLKGLHRCFWTNRAHALGGIRTRTDGLEDRHATVTLLTRDAPGEPVPPIATRPIALTKHLKPANLSATPAMLPGSKCECAWKESNLLPRLYQSRNLPVIYMHEKDYKVFSTPTVGVEPTRFTLTGCCSTGLSYASIRLNRGMHPVLQIDNLA